MAVGGVDGDGEMVARHVHDASGNNGGRFGRRFFGNRVRANFGELLHVAGSDLSQRAVTRAVEIVVRIGPITVFRLGRSSRRFRKATDRSERDRQRRDEK